MKTITRLFFRQPYTINVKLIKRLTVLLLVITIMSAGNGFAQTSYCVGDVINVSIPRNIGCSYGPGNNAQWDGASGGTINDPGGSASSFTVTWTQTGTFRLKRTFPSGCTGTPLYSSYFTISAKPATPLSSEVNQQPQNCGQVLLSYTGGSSAYWQTSQYGTSQTDLTTKVVSSTGTYYARIKNGNCWSDARSITVSSIPASPVGGTLSGGGTVIGNFSENLTLSGYTGSIVKYQYSENGGPPVNVSHSSSTLNVNFSNQTTSQVTRQYWAVISLNGCETNSSTTSITVNPIPTPNASISVAQQIRQYSCTTTPPSGAYSEGATYYWKVTNGTIASSNNTVGSASATVDWGTSKTGVLTFCFYGYATWSTLQKFEVPLCTFNYTSCNNTEVKQTNPLSGSESYEWWWQLASDGTSLDHGNESSFTMTAPGPLYLRARLRYSPHLWGPTLQSLGAIPVDTIPATPTQSTDGYGFYNGSVVVSVGSVANATGYNWYTTPTTTIPYATTTTNSLTIENFAENMSLYVSTHRAAVNLQVETLLAPTWSYQILSFSQEVRKRLFRANQ